MQNTMRTSISYGYGVRNNEEERILEFCATMNMKIGNTLKRSSHSNHLWVWSIKNWSRLLLCMEEQKEVFERYKNRTHWRVYHRTLDMSIVTSRIVKVKERHQEKVCTQEKDMKTTGRQCKEWFQLIHSVAIIEKILLLKVGWNILQEALQGVTNRYCR